MFLALTAQAHCPGPTSRPGLLTLGVEFDEYDAVRTLVATSPLRAPRQLLCTDLVQTSFSLLHAHGRKRPCCARTHSKAVTIHLTGTAAAARLPLLRPTRKTLTASSGVPATKSSRPAHNSSNGMERLASLTITPSVLDTSSGVHGGSEHMDVAGPVATRGDRVASQHARPCVNSSDKRRCNTADFEKQLLHCNSL
jgi:hypothetical protein